MVENTIFQNWLDAATFRESISKHLQDTEIEDKSSNLFIHKYGAVKPGSSNWSD